MDKGKLIIGEGLAGVCAAVKYRLQGYKVILIEKSNRIGGLLQGIIIEDKEFPIGTHILRKTGQDYLDQIIFPDSFN